MPENPIYKYSVSTVNEDGISFATIVRTPRIFKPADLEAARLNLKIEGPQVECPQVVNRLVHYVLSDFFILLHRTGLYNRQSNLWECLSRITSVHVVQLKTGIFRKTPLPVFDLFFNDGKNRPTVLCRVLEPQSPVSEKDSQKFLSGLLGQAQTHMSLNGLLYCCRKPFPELVLNKVIDLTQSNDPVGKYESRLPPPHSTSFDLLEIEIENLSEDSFDQRISAIKLVHPDLNVPQRPRAVQRSESA